MLGVYGIKTCDTCRKAMKWLDAEGIEYEWTDIRADGLSAGQVDHWLVGLGPEQLVNRRSRTWAQLEPERRPQLDSEDWLEVLLEMPTLIKRPVFVHGQEVRVGFNEATQQWLKSA